MSTPLGPVEEEWKRVLADIIIPLEDNLDGGIKHNISSNLYTTIFTLIYRLCTASDENCAYIYEQCALVSTSQPWDTYTLPLYLFSNRE